MAITKFNRVPNFTTVELKIITIKRIIERTSGRCFIGLLKARFNISFAQIRHTAHLISEPKKKMIYASPSRRLNLSPKETVSKTDKIAKSRLAP
jgi:hypothetical protein